MPDFPITSKKREQLRSAMHKLGLYEKDLQESFVRSGGPGGQNVNKVSTCVILKHGPTQLTVRCSRHRTQAMNRFEARRLLIKKLDQLIRGQESAEAKRISKIKRQKRKRSKRAKEKMLKAKKERSEKKKLRGKVTED